MNQHAAGPKGALAAADTMRKQRTAPKTIIGKGGDGVLARKANQASLHKDVAARLDDSGKTENMLAHHEIDGGHGRVEKGTATVSHNVESLQEIHRWAGLWAVGKIKAVRDSEGRTATETRHYIMSRETSGFRDGLAEPLSDQERPAPGP